MQRGEYQNNGGFGTLKITKVKPTNQIIFENPSPLNPKSARVAHNMSASPFWQSPHCIFNDCKV